MKKLFAAIALFSIAVCGWFAFSPTEKTRPAEFRPEVAEVATLSVAPRAQKRSSFVPPLKDPTIPAPIPRGEDVQAVRDWSTDLGRSMLTAFHDEAAAARMFSFLRECAEDQNSPMVYRAVCAGNAKRLADKFPDRFAQNYTGLQRGLPDRIQEFLAQAYTNF